jgi:hypothetical protein
VGIGAVLFNSHEFIFVYVPVVLAGFFLIAKLSPRFAAAWLCLASLFFYGWWNPNEENGGNGRRHGIPSPG